MSRKMELGLVQFNAPFLGQSYLPLSVGMLWSQIRSKLEASQTVELAGIEFDRDKFDQIVQNLSETRIIGISIYTWNEQISLMLAKKLKQRNPECIIIFGGPQVPDEGKKYLERNQFIDILIHGEGEQGFCEVVKSIVESVDTDLFQELSRINGVTFSYSEGGIRSSKKNQKRPRSALLELSSPFLDGTFDGLMRANPNQRWMALWETNRGCPFSCTFCDWGSATNSKVSQFDIPRLEAEFEWIAKNEIEFVFLCDANFGLLPRDVEIAQMMARVASRYGYPKRVSTQGTKNLVDRSFNVQKILFEAGIGNGAALSMQSLDNQVLRAIERENIPLIRYRELAKRYREAGIPTYVDLILGLPQESLTTFKHGIESLIENGSHDHIQFNNLSLLPNAKMSQDKYREEYGLVTIHAPVESIHGLPTEATDVCGGGVLEHQELVIATKTMPHEDWRSARVFAWSVSLFHLNKLIQPQILLARFLNLGGYRSLIDGILEYDSPVVGSIVKKLRCFAEQIQSTGKEYFSSEKYLGINWTADEYLFIELVSDGTLNAFIDEVEKHFSDLITKSVPAKNHDIAILALSEATTLSRELLMLPHANGKQELQFETNLPSLIENQRRGLASNLEKSKNKVVIDRTNPDLMNLNFEEWMRKVVWYRNKRGDYCWSMESEIIEKPSGVYR